MKKIFTFLGIILMYLNSFSQATVKVYPAEESFATGYIDVTDKGDGQAKRAFPNFFMFDLSDVPNHGTITSIDLTYFISYSSVAGSSIGSDVYIIDANTIATPFQTLKDTIDNAGYVVWSGDTYSGINYGGIGSTETLNSAAVDAANNALLYQDWLSFTIKYDNYIWEIEGWDNEFSKPYLEITYTPGTPVTAITITSPGDETTIDSPSGSLQLSATVEPASPTFDSVVWEFTDPAYETWASIDENGLLTALGVADVTVIVRAVAWDGSGITQTYTVTLTNQTSSINNQESQIKVFPNPATDILKIVNNTEFDVQLINVLGEVIYSENNLSEQTNINVESFVNGLYFVKITDSNSEHISKVIIK